MAAAHDQFGGVRQCPTRSWLAAIFPSPGGPLRGRLRRLSCAVWCCDRDVICSDEVIVSALVARDLGRRQLAGGVPPARYRVQPGGRRVSESRRTMAMLTADLLHNGMQRVPCRGGAVGCKYDTSFLAARRRHLIAHGIICIRLRSFR